MTTRHCDACGKPISGGIGMGGALLCRDCESDIRVQVDQLHAQGKSVNVLHIAKRIYQETHAGGDYILRQIPKELWARAKHRAVDDEISLKELLFRALEKYLSK